MALTLRTVNLATLVIGSSFYGLYCVLFFISLYLLVLRKSIHDSSQSTTSHRVHKRTSTIFRSFLFTTAILLFVTVTCHWIIIVYRAFLAFGSEGDADAFYSNNKHITFLLLDIFLTVVSAIGDLLILYRLWIVWSKSKLVVVLPICSMLLWIESWRRGVNICHQGEQWGILGPVTYSEYRLYLNNECILHSPHHLENFENDPNVHFQR
ncbi:hypothetical protein K438DRAFT_1823461 [Mycena galopus ATCC 62051]|nr:hypothetical protein K438DRAFT_1823461 [Mycena galopus ATCC 62051]